MPAVVRNKAVSVGAGKWLADIDGVVADLADGWGLTIGAPYEEGTEAFVAAVELADGTPAVLKVLVPRSDDAAAHEVRVLACAERRRAAHDDDWAVLVHGDVHQWNALRAGDGWSLVDPDGLRAEPEYDLGILMREDPMELLQGGPWNRAHLLADRCGCDATAIWEWGVVERVSTGLLATAIDLQPEGRRMLRAADVVAGAVSGSG